MAFTLRQLRYFVALARARHFGRAAALVHVSQPALSAQIKELEGILGGQLVERRARDVVLTPFGRAVLGHAQRVLTQVDALENAARGWAGLGGQLRLGVIPTIAPYILPDTLERLRSDDVSLQVLVHERKTDALIADLRAGDLDAAVLALPVHDPDLTAIELFDDAFLLAGTADALARLGSPETLRPTGVAASSLLLLEDGHCLSDQALEVCGRGAEGARIDMGVSSLATLTQLVGAGFGLTLMPELAAPVECRDRRGLMLQRFKAPEPARRIGLVRRASTRDDGWVAQLRAVLTRAGQDQIAKARALWP